MKEYALQYLARPYIVQNTGLKEGVLVLGQDSSGFIEYFFSVRLMKQVTLELTGAVKPVWSRYWFEHTPHWIAYHYEIDIHRKIVIKHTFGGLRASVQLIDSTENNFDI